MSATPIRKSLSSGIIYTALARYIGIFFSIIIGSILARLLTPAEFGIVALVTVFVNFFNLMSEFGLGPAVVQNNFLSDSDLQYILSFSILLSILLAGLFFLSAPLIASFYNQPKLVSVSKLLSLSILFNSLQIIPKAIYQKALKFKQMGIISISVQLFSGIVAIVLAYSGYGYYSIIIQSILTGVISLIVYYLLVSLTITIKIKIRPIRKILRFSIYQFMFNFINYFSRNSDNLLVGKFFGEAMLGYYDKSYRLMLMPVQNLTNVITPVLMPILSKYQDNKELIYNTYIKVVKILATIGFPLSIFLYFSAPELINIIYGPQWHQSIPVFKLLALTVGAQMVLSSTGSIFQAVNRTDLLFYSGFLSAIFIVGGICYGVFFGKTLVSIGYGLITSYIINFLQIYYLLINKALNRSLIQFLKIFYFPVLISIGIEISLLITSKFNINHIILLFIIKLLIACVVFSIIYLSRKENREMVKLNWNNTLKKK